MKQYLFKFQLTYYLTVKSHKQTVNPSGSNCAATPIHQSVSFVPTAIDRYCQHLQSIFGFNTGAINTSERRVSDREKQELATCSWFQTKVPLWKNYNRFTVSACCNKKHTWDSHFPNICQHNVEFVSRSNRLLTEIQTQQSLVMHTIWNIYMVQKPASCKHRFY